MAKSETATVVSSDVPFDLDSVVGLSLDELPEPPKAPPGTYVVRWISHKIDQKVGAKGPYTQVVIGLDLDEAVEVEDEVDIDEMPRMFYRTYLSKQPRDLQTLSRLVKAFGVPANVKLLDRAEDGSIVYPAFEEARGGAALADAFEDEYNGKTEMKLRSFRAA